MSELSKLKSKKQSTLREALDELDLSAGEELDGHDLEDSIDVSGDDQIESDLEGGIEKPSIEQSNNDSGYQITNVSEQLDGMVEHWFQLTQNVPANKKEAFLKLGDRLSELNDVLKSEFLDAR